LAELRTLNLDFMINYDYETKQKQYINAGIKFTVMKQKYTLPLLAYL